MALPLRLALRLALLLAAQPIQHGIIVRSHPGISEDVVGVARSFLARVAAWLAQLAPACDCTSATTVHASLAALARQALDLRWDRRRGRIS